MQLLWIINMPIVGASQTNIQNAVNILKNNGVVGFPTETVYGLGCDTRNRTAISRVYTLKNRPNNNPMIAHVLDIKAAKTITTGWDSRCDLLATTFWPGALTIILERNPSVPKEACGGLDTIAVRSPHHKVARELLIAFGSTISAPSANISGFISPTTAAHVHDDFGDSLYILDGGACRDGIESTVLSMVKDSKILRLGAVSQQKISEIIGEVTCVDSITQSESPGTRDKHYAPKAKLVLRNKKEIVQDTNNQTVYLLLESGEIVGHNTIQMPKTATEYAKKLYGAIREADKLNPQLICVETPPTTPEWVAVNDRLSRASSS